MIDLKKCNIDRLHVFDVTVVSSTDDDPLVSVKARIGYRCGIMPVGEVEIGSLDEDDDVDEAAKTLIKSIEEAAAKMLGERGEDRVPEKPRGLFDVEEI